MADRVFSIVTVTMAIFTTPLWAAYGDAIGSGDQIWIKRVLTISITRVAVAATVLSIAIILVIRPIFSTMNVDISNVGAPTLIGMGTQRVFESVCNAIGAYLFAANYTTIVVATGLGVAIISILLKLQLTPLHGSIALPWITAGSLLFLSIVPCMIYIRIRNKCRPQSCSIE